MAGVVMSGSIDVFFQQGHSLGPANSMQRSGLKISRILSTSCIAEWTGCVEYFLTSCTEAESAPALSPARRSVSLSLPADYRSPVDLGCGAFKLCDVGAAKKLFSDHTKYSIFFGTCSRNFSIDHCSSTKASICVCLSQDNGTQVWN